jgi:tRNA G10  N-methylase Trm11
MGETAAEVPVLDWKGAYSSSWVGILSPGSMSHPAKFSRGLLDRLLDHGFARGWWEKGSILGDPFGGVGCGGILAAYKGLGWIGIELESRFTSLARENFAKHRRRWEAAGDPRPVILRGDSRHFARLVRTGLAAIITSPPYADGVHGRNGIDVGKCERPGATSQARSGGYGTAAGQVGQMREDTYWSACKDIYSEVLKALKAGGVFCVVLKSYVRAGEVIDLPGQTLRLLCSLGFTPVERIRAWLVEERREAGLFGAEVVTKTSKKGFFRRLHEKKRPGTEIDFEEVLVVRAPGGGTCPDTYDSAGGP